MKQVLTWKAGSLMSALSFAIRLAIDGIPARILCSLLDLTPTKTRMPLSVTSNSVATPLAKVTRVRLQA